MAIQPDLNQKLATCRDPQTLKAAAPALVAEARTKGMSGKPEAALSLFQEAKKLDRSITLDPQTEINPYFIPKGERLAQEGDIKAALVAYDEAIKRNPNIKISAASWNILCWNGIIYNSASQVVFACDNAVNLKPDDLDVRNIRAVARALAGDTNGAIADIEFMLPKIYRQNLESFIAIKEKEYPSITYSEQQSRLDDLKEGKNPFPDEKLEEWRQQAKKDRDS
jgi:tetratricopeptide (TPR) repeat protein